MSVDEALSNKLNELNSICREYVAWYTAFSKQVAYAGEGAKQSIAVPKSFIAWYLQASLDEALLVQESMQQLKSIHDELHAAGKELTQMMEEDGGTLPEDAYANLASLFDAFVAGLLRLQRDCMLESTGVDPYSGLLNRRRLTHDYSVEMERFERQGPPFCLALVRIDEFGAVQAENDAERVQSYVQTMVKLIKKSLRSFDDAYAIGYGEFILCLKQSDITGGVSTLDRLRGMLEGESLRITIHGEKSVLTFSSCIAAPVEGDPLDQLLENLKDDLNMQAERTGSIVEYQEISALERYVKSQAE